MSCVKTHSVERDSGNPIKWILGPHSNVLGCSIGLVPILVLEYHHGAHKISGSLVTCLVVMMMMLCYAMLCYEYL